MRSLNGSIHTTQTPPPLSFYNTFKHVDLCLIKLLQYYFVDLFYWRSFLKCRAVSWESRHCGEPVLRSGDPSADRPFRTGFLQHWGPAIHTAYEVVAEGQYLDDLIKGSPILDRLSSTERPRIHTAHKEKFLNYFAKRSPILSKQHMHEGKFQNYSAKRSPILSTVHITWRRVSELFCEKIAHSICTSHEDSF